MKTCPYCAEEIKDHAIRCRWCHAWLVDDVPAGADDARPPAGLGAGTSTSTASSASSSEPLTSSTTSTPATTGATGGAGAGTAATTGADASDAPTTTPAATTTATSAATTSGAGAAPSGEPKVEFTHTGSRFLLGYGGDFFGIWDRNAPQQPIERFPRNDQGWTSAWQRYASIEQNWMDLRTGQKSQ